MDRRSRFGEKLSQPSGILELMEDLGKALTSNREAVMMGGGNPAQIPAMQELWARQMEQLVADRDRFGDVLANYDPPAGNPDFLAKLAAFLNRECGWDLTPNQIAVTNGGQTGFFFLLNLFGGSDAAGRPRKILLPLAPEYIGYANQGIEPDLFEAVPARIANTGDHRFKYHIDFDRLEVTPEIGAMCVSRPTNPSANVISNAELDRLARLAEAEGIPLLIDNAYGLPFPGVIFARGAKPYWRSNTIQTLSLSKLGLPGTRTGFVVGPEKTIEHIAALTAVVGLANNNIGQAMVNSLLESGRLAEIAREIVRPYYRKRRDDALSELDAKLAGLPYRVHEPEGAFFLWLWMENLPISSRELYLRLKEKGLLVVPGDYFFYGVKEWRPHQEQCLRISYTQAPEKISQGFEILESTLRELYCIRQ